MSSGCARTLRARGRRGTQRSHTIAVQTRQIGLGAITMSIQYCCMTQHVYPFLLYTVCMYSPPTHHTPHVRRHLTPSSSGLTKPDHIRAARPPYLRRACPRPPRSAHSSLLHGRPHHPERTRGALPAVLDQEKSGKPKRHCHSHLYEAGRGPPICAEKVLQEASPPQRCWSRNPAVRRGPPICVRNFGPALEPAQWLILILIPSRRQSQMSAGRGRWSP